MDTFLKELEAGLSGVLNHVRDELHTVRSNRPSVQLIENITVESYGQRMSVKQLGSLSVQPPRDIIVTLWDKGLVSTVMKAIQDANMGLSVSNDGTIVRATLPQLTNERREEFMKLAKKMAEQGKIQIRARRDEINKKVKAAEEEGSITKDQAFKGKERIQALVDETNKAIEAVLEKKLAELAE